MSNETSPILFHAIIADYSYRQTPRNSRLLGIVRETRTQWIAVDDTRWWKKNNRQVGVTSSLIYDYRIIAPGHEHYDQDYVDTSLKKAEARRFTDKLAVAAVQESVEDIAPFIRELADMLDVWERNQ